MTNQNTTTDSGPAGVTERSSMDRPTRTRRRAGRRLLVAGTGVAAAALLVTAAAWACTLRDGSTLKVFNLTKYPSATCGTAGSPTGSACSKAIGNGAQTGLATVDTAGDDVLSIAGNGFTDATGDINYSITWRHPGSTGNCHRTNPDGSIVQMGASATVTSSGTLDVTRSAIQTSTRTPSTGLVRICVQDYEFGDTGTASPTPTVVVGQIVDVDVTL